MATSNRPPGYIMKGRRLGDDLVGSLDRLISPRFRWDSFDFGEEIKRWVCMPRPNNPITGSIPPTLYRILEHLFR